MTCQRAISRYCSLLHKDDRFHFQSGEEAPTLRCSSPSLRGFRSSYSLSRSLSAYGGAPSLLLQAEGDGAGGSFGSLLLLARHCALKLPKSVGSDLSYSNLMGCNELGDGLNAPMPDSIEASRARGGFVFQVRVARVMLSARALILLGKTVVNNAIDS